MQTLGILCAAGPAAAGEEQARLYDVVRAPGYEGEIWHFRFVRPGLAPEDLSAPAMVREMARLCDSVARPRLQGEGVRPERVVIALADRETEFGQPAPEAVQGFDAFVIRDGACIREPF